MRVLLLMCSTLNRKYTLFNLFHQIIFAVFLAFFTITTHFPPKLAHYHPFCHFTPRVFVVFCTAFVYFCAPPLALSPFLRNFAAKRTQKSSE